MVNYLVVWVIFTFLHLGWSTWYVIIDLNKKSQICATQWLASWHLFVYFQNWGWLTLTISFFNWYLNWVVEDGQGFSFHMSLVLNEANTAYFLINLLKGKLSGVSSVDKYDMSMRVSRLNWGKYSLLWQLIDSCLFGTELQMARAAKPWGEMKSEDLE